MVKKAELLQMVQSKQSTNNLDEDTPVADQDILASAQELEASEASAPFTEELPAPETITVVRPGKPPEVLRAPDTPLTGECEAEALKLLHLKQEALASSPQPECMALKPPPVPRSAPTLASVRAWFKSKSASTLAAIWHRSRFASSLPVPSHYPVGFSETLNEKARFFIEDDDLMERALAWARTCRRVWSHNSIAALVVFEAYNRAFSALLDETAAPETKD